MCRGVKRTVEDAPATREMGLNIVDVVARVDTEEDKKLGRRVEYYLLAIVYIFIQIWIDSGRGCLPSESSDGQESPEVASIFSQHPR